MARLSLRVALACALAVAGDLLLFGCSPGVGLTVFALLLGLVALARYEGRLMHAGFWPVLWVVLALGASVEDSAIGRLLLVALGWSILALALMPAPRTLFAGFLRGATGGIRSFGAGPTDARRYALLLERTLSAASVRRFPFWVYALPALLVAAFSILIVPANLVLSRWSTEFFDWCAHALTRLAANRVLFWLILGLGCYGVLRFRLGKRKPPLPPAASAIGEQPANELRATLLAFAGLNGLYLAANATDLAYLWLAFELPKGMTYSQFAHEGSYRLIVAVVLAALTIVAFFRAGTLQSHVRASRLLGYLFIFQNMVVLLGAGRRLMLYIDVYGLTRFRLATFLWLLLVCGGYLLLWMKLFRNKPFAFLLETNAVTTVVLLGMVSVLNLDGYIADWNVARFEAGNAGAVDVDYLGELESGALPALARLARSAPPPVSTRAQNVLTRQLAREKALHSDWRAWTWRRETAIREAEAQRTP